ncbi:MAG: hypothetical protein JWR49_2456, partial [Tardiphaga sp.]|nr:hypothetical protein [Tardiphaga sp.]
MGHHIQCSGIHRGLVSTRRFGALRFENVVNFFFDIRQLRLGVDVPNPARVSPFSFGIGVVHDDSEADATSSLRPLKHLQVAVGVAECRNWT